MTNLPPVLKKRSPIARLAVGIFLFSFSVYAYSAAPTNPGYADSDEIITSAYTLGVAHPPGYPLMIVLTRLFATLPIPGTFAFRANLFAGFLQALTVAGMFWLGYQILTDLKRPVGGTVKQALRKLQQSLDTRETTIDPLAAVSAATAALLLAFSALFWLYASVIEVFPLNNVLVVAGLISAWQWRRCLGQDNPLAWRWFLATAVITGVGLSHVQSYLFLLPAFLVFLILTLHEKKRWQHFFPSHLGWLIGGLVSGFVVPASLLFGLNHHKSDYSWSFDQTLNGWWRMLLRQDYHGYIPDKEVTAAAYNVSLNSAHYLKTLPRYLEFLNTHFAYLGLGLGLIGIGYLYWQHRRLFWLLAPFYFISGLWFALYLGLPDAVASNLEYRSFVGVTHRQYLQGEVLWTLYLLFGVWAIGSYLLDLLKVKKTVTLLLAMLGVMAVSWSFWSNHLIGFQRHNQFAWHYARSILDRVEPGAVIFCSADLPCFSLFYQQTVEKYRPDVTVIPQNNHLAEYKLAAHPELQGFNYPENPFFFANLVSWNVSHHPTYLTDAAAYYINYIGLEGNPFFLVPNGMLFKVVKKIPDTVPGPDYPATQYMIDLSKPTENYWLNGIQDYLASVHNIHGIIYSHLGLKEAARTNFDLALTLKPDYENPKSFRDSLVGYPGNPSYQLGSESSSSAQLVDAGRAKEAAKSLQEAYIFFQKATFVEPKDARARLELARLYKLGGYPTEARREYQHVLKFNPDNEEAKQELGKLSAVN